MFTLRYEPKFGCVCNDDACGIVIASIARQWYEQEPEWRKCFVVPSKHRDYIAGTSWVELLGVSEERARAALRNCTWQWKWKRAKHSDVDWKNRNLKPVWYRVDYSRRHVEYRFNPDVWHTIRHYDEAREDQKRRLIEREEAREVFEKQSVALPGMENALDDEDLRWRTFQDDALRLSVAMQTSMNIKLSTRKITYAAKAICAMVDQDKIPIEEIRTVIEKLAECDGTDTYFPQFETGGQFRYKFKKIKRAVERQYKEFIEPTKPPQHIKVVTMKDLY